MHGWKNTNGFSEDPRVAGGSPLPTPATPSICRLERPAFGRFRGRAGEPEEIAAVVCFMASDLASYMTGEIVNVNGGSVLCG